MRKHFKNSWSKAGSLVLLILMICLASSCDSQKSSSLAMSDNEIIDRVVENFTLLASVPRPSHHEEKISAFLMDWSKKEGLEPVQDHVGNVMFEVPATEGLEDLPLVIFQGHMDMVVAVDDDKDFDALSDPITVIRDDTKGTLTADGTSLGGDDGIGLAIAMAVTQGSMPHGPLRIIITVDEEDGMHGAFNLDSSWLEGASSLINIDNETADEVLVSTASGDLIQIDKEISYADPLGDLAVRIRLSNLMGGHSGVEIDKGRLNGIIGLAGFLKRLSDTGLFYELASFSGGTASNAIPTGADAVIVIKAEDKKKLSQIAKEYCEELRERFAGIEEDIRIDATEEDDLPQVISDEEKDHLLRFVTEVINGVYSMSTDMEGLVVSSSNLGVLKVDNGKISIMTSIRSSLAEKEEEIVRAQTALAKVCGYKTTKKHFADPWAYDPDSKLLARTKRIYKEQNGEEIKVVAVHAGLECGAFKKMNPDLDMISIGPDLKGAHTVNETLYLNSIPKVWHLLEGLLS